MVRIAAAITAGALSLVALAVALPAAVHADDWDDWYGVAGWKFRQKVTIPATGVVGEHEDFPIFLDLGEMDRAFFLKVRADGGDIRVTRGDGTTEVPREVVFVDTVNRAGEIHFLAPTLSTDLADREYYVYFGNEAAEDYEPDDLYGQRAVWANGYVGVFHKQAAGAGAVLNSVEGNHGSTVGGVAAGNGYMGGALHYDGETGSYVAVAHSSLLDVTGDQITMSAWVHPTAIRQNGYILNKRTGQFGYGLGVTNEYDPSAVEPIVNPAPCAATPNTNPDDLRNLKAWAISNGFTTLTASPSPCIPAAQGSIAFTYHEPVQISAVGNWNYFVATYDGTDIDDPRLNLYWNATLAESLEYKGPEHDPEDPTSTLLRPTTADLYIGVLTPPGVGPNILPFVGAIDEVRISEVARSDDWIATEHNNQSDPEGFVEAAPVEAGAGVTLQDLIDITPDGGTLELPLIDPYGIVDPGEPGVYEIDEALVIADDRIVTVVGLVDDIVIRQTTAGQRVLTVGTGGSCSNEVVLENLTITGGDATGTAPASSGGGIRVEAGCDLTLHDVLVTDNTAAAEGGGISVAGTLTAYDSTIHDNSSPNAGGVSFLAGSVGHFENVDVTGNSATGTASNGRGGGVRINANNGVATLTWSGGTISGNQTAAGTADTGGGAGIHIQGNQTGAGASLHLSGVSITANTTASSGGGIFLGGNVSVTFENVDVTGNAATGDGGGVHFGFVSADQPASLHWISGSLADNTAGGDGGGAFVDGADRTLTLRRVDIADNTAGVGDALFRANGTVDAVESWWGTDDEDDLATQEADIQGRITGAVTFDPWCLYEGCDAELTVVADAALTVTSVPAGIDVTGPGEQDSARFVIDHLAGATFTPTVQAGTVEVTLTEDPDHPYAAWTPALGAGGEVELSPALSSGPDVYTLTLEFALEDVSVGAGGSLLSATPTTGVVADGSDDSTVTVQLRDVDGNPVELAGVEVTFTTTLGVLDATAATVGVDTDAAGIASVTLTSTATGLASITAEIAGVGPVANGSPAQVTFVAVDRSALQAAVDAAVPLLEDDYTPGSWGPFDVVLAHALDVLADPTASQVAIDAATSVLIAAQAALVDAGDKSALQALVTQANELDEDDYTAGSWADLIDARDAAQAVLDDVDAGEADVALAYAVLEAALAGLVDLTGLVEALDLAYARDEPDYTAASWTVLADAAAAAEAVLADPDATQGQVDAAEAEVRDALAALVPSDVADALAALVATILGYDEDDYTADSWDALQAALVVAQDALVEPHDDGELGVAWFALSAAHDALVYLGQLRASVDIATSESEVLYTPASWAPFEAALADAQGVLADPGATQEEVDVARAALDAARAALVLRPVDPPSAPSAPPGPSAPVPVPGEAYLPSPWPGRGEASVDGEHAPIQIFPTPRGVMAIGGDIEVDLSLTDRGGLPSGWVDGTSLRILSSGEAFLSAFGLQPNSTVWVWLFSEPILLGEIEVGNDGRIDDALLLFPDQINACDHTLQVVGTAVGGRVVALSIGVSLVPDPFPFEDVTTGYVHAPAIGCAQERGVVTGFADGDFRPAGNLTRGQLMSMLHRILGPNVGGAALTFTDIDGSAHAQGIRALAGTNLVRGFSDGTFRPDERITRGQFASVIAAALQLDPAAFSANIRLTDIEGNVHASAINALHNVGVLTGYADGSFHPGEPISRAQATSILMRFIAGLGSSGPMPLVP